MADRPPFILCFAGDSQGCGFHRVMTPLASLVSPGVANGRIDISAWDDDVALACAPDVIIWQRQVEDGQLATMQRWREKLPKAVFIFELDDYLDEIPAASFHASFMPPDIRSRIVRAMALCDRVTTSTGPMARWLTELLPERSKTPVIVVPNALPAIRLQERPLPVGAKLRIGFCGGMSHSGDLELIKPAMAAIGDEVEWVFFGTQPEDAPVPVEFHTGVPPHMYLDKLASLNMNLMLAPLEANRFNDCKSNLRLLEAVTAGACVIAQDAVPYRENKPPIQYADTPDSWTRAIRAFMGSTPEQMQRDADMLRVWANRHYSLEKLLPDRMQAWLPQSAGPHWQPRKAEPSKKLAIACRDRLVVTELRDALSDGRSVRFSEQGLEIACREAVLLGSNVLWLRPGAILGKTCIPMLQAAVSRTAHCAAVVPLASDGWNAFPQTEHWTPLPRSVVDVLCEIVGAEFEDTALPVQAPVGPAIFLTIDALCMFGIPDVAGNDGNEEQALLEWGLNATARGWQTVQAAGTFASATTAPVAATQKSVTRLQARGYGDILNTKAERILTAASRQKIEVELLKLQWGGPRPGSMGFDNTYESWSTLRQVQAALLNTDKSAPAVCRFHSMQPEADLYWHTDGWVVFTDATIETRDTARDCFNAAIARAGDDIRVLYADHETLAGTTRAPEFKPDFDQTLLMAQDYVTPLCAIRADMINAPPKNRLELFECVLTILREHGRKAFGHVQQILGSMTDNATPEARALDTLHRQTLINRMFGPGLTVTPHPQLLGCLSAAWTTPLTPSVGIVIPTLGYGRLLEPCIKTILQHTAYAQYEILVVQNGDRKEPELSPALLDLPNIRTVYWARPFNWAAVNNWAIRQLDCEYIVTLNDDVCIAGKNWLGSMLAHAVMPDVGAVGAKLIHPAGVLQHVGVVCHNGVAGHMHKGQANGTSGYLGRALLTHEAVAVTGACMLFSRKNFEAVGGFNEQFAMNYNDTVFCLDLHARGKRNVVDMSVDLLHPEASTRATSDTPAGQAVLLLDNMRLAKLHPEPDPYWNDNLQIQVSQGGLMLQGLNADMLAWRDFVPRPGADRVLLINDLPGAAGRVLPLTRAGSVPFMADLSGFKLRLTAPSPLNVAAWDVRNARDLARGLQALGINRVVLRSLVGRDGAAPPVETLRTLSLLRPSIAVEIDPVEVATVAPWLADDFDQYDEDKTVFGYVDMATWKSTYDSLAA